MSEQQMITCPNCGANLRIDDDRDIFFCEYCGTKIQNPARKKIDVHTEHTFRFVNQNKLERERMENENMNRNASKYGMLKTLGILMMFFIPAIFCFLLDIINRLFLK